MFGHREISFTSNEFLDIHEKYNLFYVDFPRKLQ